MILPRIAFVRDTSEQTSLCGLNSSHRLEVFKGSYEVLT